MTTPDPHGETIAPETTAAETEADPTDPARCDSCGGPHASTMDTPDGPARLCPPCATLHGLGCP